MKRVILILGAQRSGTSVTSHLLSELGVHFGDPDRFIQMGHNPIFFELKWINELNNCITKALGYQYVDFFLPLETDFLAPKILPQIQALEAEIDRQIEQEWHDREINPPDSQDFIIGIKDPRISLTFPVWERVLLARGYSLQIVHAFRSPTGFLQSNQKLFYQWEGWTADRHLHFWLQLNLAAIYFTRRHPVHLLNYDSLMQSPSQEVSQLVSALSLDASLLDKATAVVREDQYHHRDRQDSLQTSIHWVNEIYRKLCDRTLAPEDYLGYRSEMLASLTA